MTPAINSSIKTSKSVPKPLNNKTALKLLIKSQINGTIKSQKRYNKAIRLIKSLKENGAFSSVIKDNKISKNGKMLVLIAIKNFDLENEEESPDDTFQINTEMLKCQILAAEKRKKIKFAAAPFNRKIRYYQECIKKEERKRQQKTQTYRKQLSELKKTKNRLEIQNIEKCVEMIFLTGNYDDFSNEEKILVLKCAMKLKNEWLEDSKRRKQHIKEILSETAKDLLCKKFPANSYQGEFLGILVFLG